MSDIHEPLIDDNPRDFYVKFVRRSFDDYLRAKSYQNSEDVFYYGTRACEEAYHMAEHIKNNWQITNSKLAHVLPSTPVSIEINQDYRETLKKCWPSFELLGLVAESKKHKKFIKKRDRQKWVEGDFNPVASLGSVCIESTMTYDLHICICGEDKNISLALEEVVDGWGFILNQLPD
ncbi:MAG TPA: hypothetical protein VGV92_00870 [Gammaproteobacteria bacterium]|nr:hypothetical protein [Gammaproteobacteria bacterium]